MNGQKTIYCPRCNKLLDKKDVSDGELFKKHCDACGIDIVYEVKVELKVYVEDNKKN
jgi:phage FluMu protein Com